MRRGSQVPGCREFDYESTRFASDLVPGRFRLLLFLFFSPIWIFLTGGALYTVLTSFSSDYSLLTRITSFFKRHKNSHNPPPPLSPTAGIHFPAEGRKKFEINVLCVCVCVYFWLVAATATRKSFHLLRLSESTPR